MSDKKKQQLGMNPSTARSRLIGDVLWSFLENSPQNKCFQCGDPMTRETYSVEHKEPWLDTTDPLKMYFDPNNIAFSHQSCNSAAARRPHAHATPEDAEAARLRNLEKAREWKRNNRVYDSQERSDRYNRLGS